MRIYLLLFFLSSCGGDGLFSEPESVTATPIVVLDRFKQQKPYAQEPLKTFTITSIGPKWRVPYSGYLTGFEPYSDFNIEQIDSVRLVIYRQAENAQYSTVYRSRSFDSFDSVNPIGPVFVQVNDFYGLEITTSETVSDIFSFIDTTGARFPSSSYKIEGELPETFDSSVLELISDSTVLPVVLHMRRPSVAIGGHSIMAGAAVSNSLYDDAEKEHVPEADIANMIFKKLGVIAVNLADGGTAIKNWTYSTEKPINNLFDSVAQLKPTYFVYDSRYNDAVSIADEADLRLRYDILLGQCNAVGTELILLDSYIPTATIEAGTSRKNEQFREWLKTWAENNAVKVIEGAYYQIGMNAGAMSGQDAEAAGERWSIKDGSDGLPNYVHESEKDNPVHLNKAGQQVLANIIASYLRGLID